MIKKRFAKLAILLIFITSIASIIFLHNSIIDASSPYQLNNLKDSIFEVNINSNTVEFNDHIGYPELRKERTMVPIRVISENMGYEVGWDDQERLVRIMNADESISVEFKVGDSFALVNGKETPMDRREDGTVIDTKSYLKGERTMVPLRFIAEAFGSNVGYRRDKGVNYITINTKNVEVNPTEPGKDIDGIVKPNEKGERRKLSNRYADVAVGNKEYTVYPKSRTIIYDGPIIVGGFQADLIGDEPAGWVEPRFAVLNNVSAPVKRSNTMYSITISNTEEYNDKPTTTVRAIPKYQELVNYKVYNADGSHVVYNNDVYENRKSIQRIYSLDLFKIGKYEDGSNVKHIPEGTVVPTTIQYTHKGYTKTYVLPIEVRSKYKH